MTTAMPLPHSPRHNQSSTKSRTIQLGDGCGSKLVPDERARLEPETIKAKPYPLADRGGNVRRLGKLADEVISLVLVCALLNKATDSSRITVSGDEETMT